MINDPSDYYGRIQRAYDRIAPSYDDSAGRYAVSRRAKQLALRVISQVTPPGGRLLDVGCYTGVEALVLAQKGFRVVGVDLSPEMIRLAENKARKMRLSDRVRFEAMRASELGQLRETEKLPFDTVYSVYGTLNLEPNLDKFKHGLAQLLKAGGSFVCGLLNPTVLYELLVAPFLMKFHGYKKLVKRTVKTRIGLGADTVDAFLYSPREFAAIMQPDLHLEQVLGLHVLYPPPRGDGGGNGLWWVARALDNIEVRVQSRFPFSDLGFFSLLVFRKA